MTMSSFGEIVEPGTRTAWEDWDDVQESNHPKLMWSKDVEVPAEIQTFYIFEGRYIADSIKSLTKFKLALVNFIQPVNVNLYQTESSDAFICVLRDYDVLLASEIVDLLKSYIAVSSNLIAILTKPIVEYQATEYRGEEYILRSLSTSKPPPLSIINTIPKLEQPNIISGVSAGAISLREISNQPGAAIIFYMEHNEEYQINELQVLLSQFNFGPVESQLSNSIMNSNLYI